MRQLETVYITWVDSEVISSWSEVTSIGNSLSVLHSVGFLLHQSPEMYVLALSYDPVNDEANAIMCIPASCVKEVKPLCAIKMST